MLTARRLHRRRPGREHLRRQGRRASTRRRSRCRSCPASRARRSSRSRRISASASRRSRSSAPTSTSRTRCSWSAPRPRSTPLRAVDDQEIGVGPVTRELQKAYLAAVNGIDERWATSSTWSSRRRPRRRRHGVRPDDRRSPLPGSTSGRRSSSLDVLRSGRLSLGPTIDRFEEAVRRGRRRAVRGRCLERDRGTPSPLRHRGRRSRRRGDHVALLVRRISANCCDLRGRDARVRRHRPADAQPRPEPRSRPRSPSARSVVAVDIYGYPCELDELRAICDAHGARARPGRVRGARRALQGRARSAHTGRRRSSPSTRTSRSRPARAAWSRPTPRRSGGCCGQPAQPGSRATRAAGSSTYGSASTTGSTTSAPRSVSASSRSSTRSSAARRRRRALRRAPVRRHRRRRAAVRRRRRARPLVVRLRRGAPGQRRPRARDRDTSSTRGSATTATSRRSTCSPTCASATGSAKGSARSPRAQLAHARAAVPPRLAQDDQAYVGDALRAALG